MILNLHSSPSLSVFKYNSLLILGVNFTSCTLVPFTSMSLCIHPSPLQHPPKEPPKINLKQTNNKIPTSLFCLFKTSLFILVTLGAVVCHTAHPPLKSVPPQKCLLPLDWFKASSTHHHWTSSKFPSGILLFPWVMGILCLSFLRTSPFRNSNIS